MTDSTTDLVALLERCAGFDFSPTVQCRCGEALILVGGMADVYRAHLIHRAEVIRREVINKAKAQELREAANEYEAHWGLDGVSEWLRERADARASA